MSKSLSYSTSEPLRKHGWLRILGSGPTKNYFSSSASCAITWTQRSPSSGCLLRKHFDGCDDRGLDRSVDLAVRLWLMVNFQEHEYQSLRSRTPCIQWEEGETLRVISGRLFPRSRWKITAKESRLHPYFVARSRQVNVIDCRSTA
jgi:hypothetical protein